MIGFSDLDDLWVIKIKKPMILCAHSTSRSSEQSTKRRSRSGSMRKVCLFSSQSVWLSNMEDTFLERFTRCAKVCGLSFLDCAFLWSRGLYQHKEFTRPVSIRAKLFKATELSCPPAPLPKRKGKKRKKSWVKVNQRFDLDVSSLKYCGFYLLVSFNSDCALATTAQFYAPKITMY